MLRLNLPVRQHGKHRLFDRMNRPVLETTPPETIDELRQTLNHRRVTLGMSFGGALPKDRPRRPLHDETSVKHARQPTMRATRFERNIGPIALDCLLPALRVRLRLEPID
jgi:hypothetical protein